MKQSILKVFIIMLIAACSPSTKIVKSWQEPNATLQQNATNKILVIAMVKDETSRRVIEDELVKRMNKNAVPSYTFLTPDMLREASGEKLNDKLKQDKYNYVLLMRLADI